MSTPPRIPIARPDLTALERENVAKVMESSWITQGPWVEKAEQKLCEITGRKFAVCCSSGTTALIAALLATKPRWDGRGNGYDIAVPGLTFAAVHNAVELVGAQCKYLGADPYSWQVPTEQWLKSLHDVRCFIAAPCYGHHGDMDEGLNVIARDSNTVLIEDCAESFLSYSANGRLAGTYGDVSCVSFYANKILMAGEGGACLTDKENLAASIRLIINHGIRKGSYQRERTSCFNGRMTDLSAAILCAQIDRRGEMLERRQLIMALYCGAAKSWKLPTDSARHAPWLFAAIPPVEKDVVVKKAAELNIETRDIFHVPFPYYAMHPIGDLRDPEWVAADIAHDGIVLPLSSAMTDEEVERVVELIRSV